MTRFLAFALPLLVLLVALFNLGVELLGLDPELGPLVGWTGDRRDLSGAYVLGSWGLEALGLTALFLLVSHPGRSRWLSGLLTGWIAWVFRGPLLVMTAVGFGRLAGGPWWRLSLRWLLLYTLAGLLLAVVARLTRLDEEDRESAPVARFRSDRSEPEAAPSSHRADAPAPGASSPPADSSAPLAPLEPPAQSPSAAPPPSADAPPPSEAPAAEAPAAGDSGPSDDPTPERHTP